MKPTKNKKAPLNLKQWLIAILIPVGIFIWNAAPIISSVQRNEIAFELGRISVSPIILFIVLYLIFKSHNIKSIS